MLRFASHASPGLSLARRLTTIASPPGAPSWQPWHYLIVPSALGAAVAAAIYFVDSKVAFQIKALELQHASQRAEFRSTLASVLRDVDAKTAGLASSVQKEVDAKTAGLASSVDAKYAGLAGSVDAMFAGVQK